MYDALLVLNITHGSIERIDLRDGAIRTVVADAGYAPDGIVYDADAGRIYWTTMGEPRTIGAGASSETTRDFSAKNGSILSANVNGADRGEVLAVGAITTGKQLDADFGAGLLYWSDREGCKVSRVGTDGADLTDLVINRPSTDKTQECVGIAVDAASGYLYWTQKGPAKGGLGRILRAGLTIPEGETAVSRTDVEVLWEGLPEPIDLQIDVDSDSLFWTDRGSAPNGNTLNWAKVPAKGERGAEPRILSRGFAEAIGLAVDTESLTAYVTDLGGRVRAVSLDPAAAVADRVIAHFEGQALTGIVGIQK
ncbi:hypothetical protein QMK17_16255 [Rhodococcus sp. G-MC3]|uniref:hypothetical protein n=1 Tax=Rhodococcus sp. G-MC3 TaxID=3046209 RepID=UPI0024B9CA91|nr:hypothetical protein [Rhodococcus sp. G-MC3]MDJ0394878.1 hypothetical protein [Rhodococcus sp. G-MC3]